MPKYQVYSEHKKTLYTVIEADSLEDAEELANINYSDYTWNECDNSLQIDILFGEADELTN